MCEIVICVKLDLEKLLCSPLVAKVKI